MDPSNQVRSLINIKPQNKLNYISVINSEPLKIENSQQSFRSVGRKLKENNFLCENIYDEDQSTPKSRKRNPQNWKQNVRKRNKNKGLEYVKANGEICEKKKLGPPCTCKEKCYVKIGMDACKKIFQSFWKLGDHALQNAYIAGCVRIFLPKHCYKKDGIPSRRFFSRNFYVTVNGVDTEVCKQAFLNIHAISNGRLDRLLKKKQEIGNTGFDERGRHNNKVNKIPIEKIILVRKHIDSVREKAGYTGKRKPKRVEILPGLLNIRTMYRSYREEMILNGFQPVCEYRYRKIFHTDFHLDFGKNLVSSSGSVETEIPQQLSQSNAVSQVQLIDYSEAQNENHIDKNLQKNSLDKKLENIIYPLLQDINKNVQINTNLKSDKETDMCAHVDIQSNKEFNVKSTDTTPYVLSQEIFRLDYSSTCNSSQQNWVFSNQN